MSGVSPLESGGGSTEQEIKPGPQPFAAGPRLPWTRALGGPGPLALILLPCTLRRSSPGVRSWPRRGISGDDCNKRRCQATQTC